MKLLVRNSGSSSVKFSLFRRGDLTVTADGIVACIGLKGTQIR